MSTATGSDARTRVLYSASERYLDHGSRALQQRFPGAQLDELAPEVGRFSLPGVFVAEVAAACRPSGGVGRGGDGAPPVPFVRHLAAEEETVSFAELARVPELAVTLARRHGLDRLALQAWSSGEVPVRAPDVRADLEAALTDHGVEVTRGGQAVVLSVCLTPGLVSLGVTASEHMLADWPGGRVVLGRPPEQVSRAEWKLEEVFKVEGLTIGHAAGPVAASGEEPPLWALDLGASPGGWARILRLRGFDVWAVDPGDLHPKVAADPGVHHARTTAGRFLAATELDFDLVVNDMRMVAEQSARVMVEAAPRLRPHAPAVMTLKVSAKRPMATVERSLRVLAAAYEPVMVRQLYHNRNEVTVVARRR